MWTSRSRSSKTRASPWRKSARRSGAEPTRSATSRRRTALRLASVAERLATAYGRPRRRLSDPLDELVATVLSQATSDRNSTRAFASLKAAFPRWEMALRAPRSAIERAIRVGGLARVKSRRIHELLRSVREREGRLDLRVLRRLAIAQGHARLLGLRGVGPKTRACVLLFACGRDAFPVDTHVHRIARRLGLVPKMATAERTHEILEPMVPSRRGLDLHLNLIRLGREVCRPRSPRCGVCALARVCPSREAVS